MIKPVSYEAVYYAESDNLPINPIAIRPTIHDRLIWWNDTTPGRGRSFEIVKLEVHNGSNSIPESIECLTKEGKKVTLRLLTNDLYNQKVKEKVFGKPDFTTDESIQKYYLETDFDL